MNTILEQRCMCDAFFSGRGRPGQVPLGWDWLVARIELLCAPRLKAADLLRRARMVLEQEANCAALNAAALDAALEAQRVLFRLGHETETDIIHALALVREAAFRVRGEKPYLVQVAGAMGILRRSIVEMATGEGKTLTSAMAAVIAGWRGRGCHVVTANDYLAARDAQEMQALYQACKLSCASVGQGMNPDERQAAYAADITYLTSKEAAADFLRDQMTLGTAGNHARVLARSLSGGPLPRLVQRGLFCAIVDEADSVLCDGGSTPLIISVPHENAPSAAQYLTASRLASGLRIGKHFLVNRQFREARLTDQGRKVVLESLKGSGSAWARRSRALELTLQAVEARNFFEESVHYVVREGKVVIVDEATGRIMPDHEWRDGMHQAVAAKEGLDVVPPRVTSARTTFQDFFLRYRSLGGMTGTAWEARGEFLQFYGLRVLRIPTNRPCLRVRARRLLCLDAEEKLHCVVEDVLREHASGRAVLVGAKSIGASERISQALTQAGASHEVLNAVQHEQEARIVSQAGRRGAITVATDMAGRGTDIKLEDAVRAAGGLHVILTEMHASARVDRQLYGRSGRQGDPGSVADIISLRDDMFSVAPAWLRGLLDWLARFGASGRFGARAAVQAAWKLAALWQWEGARRAFAQRRQLVRDNRRFADMISYSGKQT